MAIKAKKEFYTVIKDEDHWHTFINDSNKKLSVIDVYLSWTGPTEMMIAPWRTISNTIEEWDTRLEFLLLDIDKIPVKIPGKSSFLPTAKPRFLMICEGQLKDEVHGVNIPEMQEKILKHIPSL